MAVHETNTGRSMLNSSMEDLAWTNYTRWQAADRYNFTVYSLVPHLEIQTLKVFSALVAY